MLWRFTAAAHGFAYLPGSGFVRGHSVDVDFVADHAAHVVRTLARAAARDPSAVSGGALPVGPDTV
ncbi:hypothetical protein ABT009_45670 [Streptomyces sp. NPDC002896]|uniref:hypothetical protein n=1 Tax=Streptomyces sp. NPDC002896 TaxID=3154438 RepID=UPI0033167C3A